jgi:hypothetical protein
VKRAEWYFGLKRGGVTAGESATFPLCASGSAHIKLDIELEYSAARYLWDFSD